MNKPSNDGTEEVPSGVGCSECCSNYSRMVQAGVFRRKSLTSDMSILLQTELRRCLSTVDLLAYGLASMLGGSIYILPGAVIMGHTGPSVFVAYLLAGLIAALNSTIYSELACRIPKAGSSYSYAYILLGELPAFLVGWSILLEYILSVATIARGWSSMLDELTHNAISKWTLANVGRLGQPDSIIAEYPDLVGVLLIIIMVFISCFGIRGGARFTAIFICLNVIVLVITASYMFVYANVDLLTTIQPVNTTLNHPDITRTTFLPFGISGLIGGTAICFNAFIGFDAISTCAEEAKSPNKSIPIANGLSVLLVTTVTSIVSLALVLYFPYPYISVEAPFLSALMRSTTGGPAEARLGMSYFMGVGCLVGLTASLLSNLVAGPRISFAMAEDGLLPRFCAKICQPFQVPVIATVCIAIITIILELLFSVESLANFLSLGTLIAYSMASIGLLVLRYTPPPEYRDTLSDPSDSQSVLKLDPKADYDSSSDKVLLVPDEEKKSIDKPGQVKHSWDAFFCHSMSLTFNTGPPGRLPLIFCNVYVLLNIVLMIVICLRDIDGHWPLWMIIVVPILLAFMISIVILLSAYKQYPPIHREAFRVPWVPLFPCLTISLNLALISFLSWITWVRYAIWLAAGLLIYFAYGVCHSVATKQEIESLASTSVKFSKDEELDTKILKT